MARLCRCEGRTEQNPYHQPFPLHLFGTLGWRANNMKMTSAAADNKIPTISSPVIRDGSSFLRRRLLHPPLMCRAPEGSPHVFMGPVEQASSVWWRGCEFGFYHLAMSLSPLGRLSEGRRRPRPTVLSKPEILLLIFFVFPLKASP